ncbi:divergent polysaccharide deacetylase family protein [Gymnodinialimonas hymeniacidonis]|uniref:divergent polysaccharide deacetylase family protein n=1 Tax=Gymnodinialimonas hymeniacidonis TaxID=3126508 RepID=UPI0034C66EAA
MGGLSVGILSGLLVSGVVLAAVSLSTPLPPRPGTQGAPALDVTVGADGAEAEEEAPVAEEVPAETTTEETGAEDGVEEEAPATEETAAETVGGEEEAAAPVEEEEAVEDAAPAAETAPAEAEAPAETAAPEDEAEAAETDETGAAAPATDIPLPAGSEFNRPPPEEEATLPATDAAPNAAAPEAPQLAGVSQAPSFDTAPAAQPQVTAEAPTNIAAAPALGAAPNAPAGPSAVAATGDAPAALNLPQVSASPAVETATAPLPEADPAPEAEDSAAAEIEAEAPEAEPADEAASAEEIAALDATEPDTPALNSPRFPTIGDDAAADDGPEIIPSETSTPRFPQVSRLPQAGGSTTPDEPEVEAEADAAPEPAPEDLPAIQAFAAPFDPSDERPVMAVVLIDEPDSRIEQATLTRFTFPVAFAIDPLHPDAAARAAIYREAGFEVLMLGTMLPDGATAVDTEVAVSAAQSVLPEAVALLDTPDSRIQGDRPVLDATVALLAETGHGLVAFPRGLNAAEQTASRAGVPGATLFRMLDDENQRATTITRFLSRAAFTASQEGTVIVAGHTRPDTVTALFSWALGDRSEGVALAPLSAVLLRASEP